MIGALGAGLILFLIVALVARWFANVPPGDIARAIRTFIAVAAGLAGTGLLIFGRFGFALIALAATVMAVRSLVAQGSAPGTLGGGGTRGSGHAEARTAYLEMRLDRSSSELTGEVRAGRFAGRRLAELGLADLRRLLEELATEDPASVALLEAYLDRREPQWRATAGPEAQGSSPSSADAAMDERLALEILGLAAGAAPEEIKAAHRRLMAQMHPDRGGSTWIASRLNEAKDHLLRRSGRGP